MITFGTVVVILFVMVMIGGWIYLFAKLGFKGVIQMFKDAWDDPWVMWF